MHQRPSEVVILRPGPVFLSFLASQLPENNLPDLKSLQTDNTAYVITKQASDEATLDEIEKHFPRMFRHEICRWLGDDARNTIETSFLDFLCCFKFELHSHIILIEPHIKNSHQLLNIKPRTRLLHWIKSSVEDQEELNNVMERVTLSQVAENSTIIIKNFPELKNIKPFIAQHYKAIFEAAMSRVSHQNEYWPKINSLQAFNQYFSVEIHTQLINLS